MTKLRLLTLLTTLAVATSSGDAFAQPGSRYRTRLQDRMLTFTDAVARRDLIRPNQRPVVHQTQLPCDIEMIPQPDGFDLVLTYNNYWANPMPLGCITVPGIRFGREVTFRDLRFDNKTATIDHNNSVYAGFGYHYPSYFYSPVWVMSEGSTVLGISLQYPVVEYNHEVMIQVSSPGGVYDDSGRNWEVNFWLQDELPARSSRTYRLSVRATENPEEWFRTLLPYRDYFQSTYGGVQYQGDARPVGGVTIADSGALRSDNRRGYAVPENWRPDRYGWREIAQHIKRQPRNGYRRVMLWTPSGLFYNNRDNNFPFQFATGMNDFLPMRNSFSEMRSIDTGGVDLGLWWGQCSKVMRTWDSPGGEVLDPDNPEHVRLANLELDMAVEVLGATMIGLDGFGFGMEPGDAYRWLRTMQQRHPRVTFVTENGLADIYHALAPTYVYSADVQTPKILTDLIIPGAETWAGVNFSAMAGVLGRQPTDAEKLAEIDRVAKLGYVAVAHGQLALDRDYSAARSYEFTIPADLRGDSTDGETTLTPQAPSQNGGGGGAGGGPGYSGAGAGDSGDAGMAGVTPMDGSGNSGTGQTRTGASNRPAATPGPTRSASNAGGSRKAKVTVKFVPLKKSGKAPAAAAKKSGEISAAEAKKAQRRAIVSRRPVWFSPPAD